MERQQLWGSYSAHLSWNDEWAFAWESMFGWLGIGHVFVGPLILQVTWPVWREAADVGELA